MATLAQQLEQIAGLGIFVVSLSLAALSYRTWRRERDRRLLVVAGAYALFMVHGLVVFLEYFLLAYVSFGDVELLEHSSSFLILAGLLAFFVAITRE
ncbi:hypothetical protein ACFQH6_09535 [Halobacteriaceae archaeon GCM10025711]